MRRIQILIGCAFLAAILAGGQGYAQERLKISYSSIDAPNANWYIAEDKRIYQKYGLDTDLIFISSSTTNVAAVVAGSVKVGNISGGAPRECGGRGRRSGLRRLIHQHLALRVGR